MSRLKTLWRLLNLRCEGMCRLASESLDRDLGLAGVGRAAVAPALLRRLLPLPAADQAPAVRHAAVAKTRGGRRAIARYRSPG